MESLLGADKDKDDDCVGGNYVPEPGSTDIQVNFVLSLALGVSAFLIFCTLRPRWKSLYAARRRRFDTNIVPALPDSFLGWIPVLYRITEEQVLSAAGLDAYVFLSFFKMALRLFAFMFLFAAAALEPINQKYDPEYKHKGDKNGTSAVLETWFQPYTSSSHPGSSGLPQLPVVPLGDPPEPSRAYLWSYLVFIYVFTMLTLWIMNSETFKIIKVRQQYLGTQSTITDRTFRIACIPKELRSESAIKILVEKLEIGLVESVTLCKDWKELDDLMAQRTTTLHKLEEVWSVFVAQKPAPAPSLTPTSDAASLASNGGAHVDEEAGEAQGLLAGEVGAHQFVERDRPQARIWYGFLRLQSRKTDAIDYYEEKLRRLDEKIKAARRKEYESSDLAFVTMDSTAACQMAIQALLDPRPGTLLTKFAPAPSDVVWHNTYAPRWGRKLRSWIITLFILGLSIVWLVPIGSLASLLNLCTIKKWAPSLAKSLSRHDITRALVQTGLPATIVSLLNVAVPYLYDFLSNYQGMLSRGDIELSIISKNFLFTFFNIFIAFTVLGTATSYWTVLRDSLKDTTHLAKVLGDEVRKLNIPYMSFIMLQGLGLFPFRLLEVGSIALYPIFRMGAKTPRDFAYIAEPPIFSYGFYLPTALLVFILCTVYSVLPGGFLMLLLGLIYFSLGHFVYKYQLLYAMDQPQHATGGAWRIIAYRIILGLVVFHLTMSGFLTTKKAFAQALLIVPLLIFTMWYAWYFRRVFVPLTRNLALRSIRREGEEAVVVENEWAAPDSQSLIRRRSTVDEDREKGLRYMNPSLVAPLEQPWIYKDPPPVIPDSNGDPTSIPPHETRAGSSPQYNSNHNDQSRAGSEPRSTTSSLSLGDTHIWRNDGAEG